MVRRVCVNPNFSRFNWNCGRKKARTHGLRAGGKRALTLCVEFVDDVANGLLDAAFFKRDIQLGEP